MRTLPDFWRNADPGSSSPADEPMFNISNHYRALNVQAKYA